MYVAVILVLLALKQQSMINSCLKICYIFKDKKYVNFEVYNRINMQYMYVVRRYNIDL